MSPVSPIADKEDKALSAAESGKVLQNPQPPRNKKSSLGDIAGEQNPSTETD
jgi:hypothetical protein